MTIIFLSNFLQKITRQSIANYGNIYYVTKEIGTLVPIRRFFIMSKIFKILFTVVLLCFISLMVSFSFADDSNTTNTYTSSQSEAATVRTQVNSQSNGETTEQKNNQATSSTSSQNNQPSARITSLSESNLQFANILSIILIVIGTLLILLAIAILIRLKG